MPVEEMFYRVFHHHEFDVVEMSLSAYMIARAKGEWAYVAIPVFLSRMFRHSAIFVRAGCGIEHPADLKGRRVGVPEYTQSAAMTARGVLQDEYGVKPGDIRWVTGGLEQRAATKNSRFAFPESRSAHSTDQSLTEMLLDGDIDALISARNPSCFGRDSNIIRLFGDHVAIEKDWYRRTGVHPIMHTVGIRTALVRAHPWLPASVMKAFAQARAICLSEIDGTGGAAMATLPWMTDYVEETRTSWARISGLRLCPQRGGAENGGALELRTRPHDARARPGDPVFQVDTRRISHLTTQTRKMPMPGSDAHSKSTAYSGYYRKISAEPDYYLCQVGRGTPGGEYHRRFWQPVCYETELGDVPMRVRALGEDLVAFEDLRGRIGVLHLHCCHRNSSLEYGMLTDKGIRCCYHGRVFDIDGAIVEMPGEPAGTGCAMKRRRAPILRTPSPE